MGEWGQSFNSLDAVSASLFINAVYQDDANSRPYSLWVHRFIYGGIALLPIYSIISFYGLSLRVEQYGWSLSRCWATLIGGLLFTFSLGYLAGIIRDRDQWLNCLNWVNIRMGWVILGFMLLVNTPLLDFRKISVQSQIMRFETQQSTPEYFDFLYFKNQLARPGYLALQTLQDRLKISHPELLFQLNRILGQELEADVTKEFLQSSLVKIRMESIDMPKSLNTAILDTLKAKKWDIQQRNKLYIFPLDLDRDGQLEFILAEALGHWLQLTLFYKETEHWKHRALQTDFQKYPQRLIKALESGDIQVKQPRWHDVTIGDSIFRLMPTAD